jgi:NAD(P)-dependent dehydrogenase (short-subunit alcohol dehydrogenase family)
LYSLKDKNAVITGGTSGIGLAVAKNFIEHGANVVITGRRDNGDLIASEIGATFVQCDATDPAQVEASLAKVESSSGKIDVLVVNAGIADDEGSVEDFDTESMKRLMDVNFNGVFYALKFGPKHMNDGGSIITTGSASGSGITIPGAGVYAASKAAVAYLTRTSALELAPREIRVNAVCPALIAGTGMMTSDDDSEDARFLRQLTAYGRMGRQDEVVGAYNFLAGGGSTFVTGQELCVDGGLSAGIGMPILNAVGNMV